MTPPVAEDDKPIPIDEPPAELAMGDMVGRRYRIVRRLGAGGMGVVYQADDLLLGQPVALKFLSAKFRFDQHRIARLRGEVRLARQISHPYVCRVYDLGEADGLWFISMEFIDGPALDKVLERVGRVPIERALEISRQLCMALGAAHDLGIVHRDLKPSNILMDSRGTVRLSDFGLAEAADAVPQAAVREGTPAYQAPEQLAGREVTTQSDLFAVGLILYEMFTGQRPFPKWGKRDLIPVSELPPLRPPTEIVPDLHPRIERIIVRCLDPNPADRPRTAYEILGELPGRDALQLMLDAGQTPSPSLVADAPAEGLLRPGLALGIAAFVVIALVMFALLNDRFRLPAWMPRDRSPRELAVKARDTLRALHYDLPAYDRAYGVADSPSLFDEIRKRDTPEQRWKGLDNGVPAVIFFWYRQSPHGLTEVARNVEPNFTIHHGQVGANTPPFEKPGEARVCLDLKGRLIELQVVPDGQGGGGFAPEIDTGALLNAAGIHGEKTVPSRVEPPLYVEQRLAWVGRYRDQPELPIRAEAGIRHGRVVFFRAVPDDLAGDSYAMAAFRDPRLMAGNAIILLMSLCVLTVGTPLAIWNWRRRRANLKGAALLAAFQGAVYLIAWLFTAHLRLSYWRMFAVFEAVLGVAVWLGILIFVAYLALEPFVRRQWPWRVIGWNRLLQGRWNDPLLGRDILIGVGMAMATLVFGNLQGHAIDRFRPGELSPIVYTRNVLTDGPIFLTATALSSAGMTALTGFFLTFSLYLLLRREWLAVAASAALALLPVYAGIKDADSLSVASVMTFNTLLGLFIMIRFGLLTLAVANFVVILLFAAPVTADVGAWFFPSGLACQLVVAALAGYGALVSTGKMSSSPLTLSFRISD
jgi:serine/threonine-protein kinase